MRRSLNPVQSSNETDSGRTENERIPCSYSRHCTVELSTQIYTIRHGTPLRPLYYGQLIPLVSVNTIPSLTDLLRVNPASYGHSSLLFDCTDLPGIDETGRIPTVHCYFDCPPLTAPPSQC